MIGTLGLEAPAARVAGMRASSRLQCSAVCFLGDGGPQSPSHRGSRRGLKCPGGRACAIWNCRGEVVLVTDTTGLAPSKGIWSRMWLWTMWTSLACAFLQTVHSSSVEAAPENKPGCPVMGSLGWAMIFSNIPYLQWVVSCHLIMNLVSHGSQERRKTPMWTRMWVTQEFRY